jgi:hypothetical protein
VTEFTTPSAASPSTAPAKSGCPRSSATAAASIHELDPRDLGREAAERAAGSMGAGCDRARDRLRVDRAEVREREPVSVEVSVELAQAHATLHGDLHRSAIE